MATATLTIEYSASVKTKSFKLIGKDALETNSESSALKLSKREIYVIIELYKQGVFTSLVCENKTSMKIEVATADSTVDQFFLQTQSPKTAPVPTSTPKVVLKKVEKKPVSMDAESDSSDSDATEKKSVMTNPSLKKKLKSFGLTQSGVKSELVERLANHMFEGTITVQSLKDKLKSYGLPQTGNKEELLYRFVEYHMSTDH